MVQERRTTPTARGDGYRYALDLLLKQHSVTNAPLDLAGL